MKSGSIVLVATAIVLVSAYVLIKPKGATEDAHVAADMQTQATGQVLAPTPSAPASNAANSAQGGPTPPPSAPPKSETMPIEAAPGAGTTNAEPVAYDITVGHGQRVSGPAIIKARQNDEVLMRITSDDADEVHLHGYNLHLKLKPGVAATLQFKAKLTGRFTYELHKSGLDLGALEVYPR